jgi:hypothetical protein
LRLNNVDENVAREIDDVLLKDAEKEDCLRKVSTSIGHVKGVRLITSSCDDTLHVL